MTDLAVVFANCGQVGFMLMHGWDSVAIFFRCGQLVWCLYGTRLMPVQGSTRLSGSFETP